MTAASSWYERDDGGPWWLLHGRDCVISLEPRPGWCDRGRWYGKVDAWGALGRDLDEADGWPRYYFDFERAQLELEAWVRNRGQWVDELHPVVHVLRHGWPLCQETTLLPTPPGAWPKGHQWVAMTDREKATCVICKYVAEHA